VSITVEDYHKVYGDTVAVAGISFGVAPGEILGLVGPNGAGKTTTLRALAGILAPTQGRLLIAGHDIVLDPLAAKRELAYVPDEPPLFERLTVWEHFRFMAAAYRVPHWRPVAEGLLERLELTEKRDALGSELSRGMKQKVAIGCGLLHAPRALLLDEPMTGLDPHGIRTMKDLIREYAANRHGGAGAPPGGGAAIIISSHQLSFVEDLSTAVLIMNRGRVLRHGRFADLRQELAAGGRHETLEELFFRITGTGPGDPTSAAVMAGGPADGVARGGRP
jgi:ABC-2 type transport system ATP-binding protein